MHECQLCNRPRLKTEHHLIPSKLHKKKAFIKKFGKNELKGRKAYLCQDCHVHIHKIYDEKYLGQNLNTLESLKNDEQIIKFITFVRKNP